MVAGGALDLVFKLGPGFVGRCSLPQCDPVYLLCFLLLYCPSYVCMYVFTSFPYRETLSAAKTVAVLANSFATLMGAESFWWSSILVILIIVHVIFVLFCVCVCVFL